MVRLTHVEARYPGRLYVEFSDGLCGEVDLSDQLVGPMFAPLVDSTYFAQVVLDEWGAPCWPNGLDLAPDGLHARLTASHSTRSTESTVRE
jgi:hypothetical protein